MLVFLISVLRALIELLGLCLLGQGVLYLIAGRHRDKNAIYQFFALITHRPQQLTARFLPRNTPPALSSAILLLLLFASWIALAWLRKSL
jgi:hypothetical protein